MDSVALTSNITVQCFYLVTNCSTAHCKEEQKASVVNYNVVILALHLSAEEQFAKKFIKLLQ